MDTKSLTRYNIQRTVEATIERAMYLVSIKKLEISQNSK